MLVDNLGQLIQHHLTPQSFQPGDCGHVAVSKDSAHIIFVPKSEKKTADLKWFCNHCFTAATFRLFLFLSIFKLTMFPWMTTYWSWEKIAVDDIALIIYCWKIALLFSFLYFCLNLLFTIFFPMPEFFLLNNFSLFIFSLFILAAPFLDFFSLLALFLSVFSLSSSSLSSPFCGREKREITRRPRVSLMGGSKGHQHFSPPPSEMKSGQWRFFLEFLKKKSRILIL